MGDGTAYKFLPTESKEYPHLSVEDIEILNDVIKRFGSSSKDEIVSAMHKEIVYTETALKGIIQFKYAESLSLS